MVVYGKDLIFQKLLYLFVRAILLLLTDHHPVSIVGLWTFISATRAYRSKDIAFSHSTLSN